MITSVSDVPFHKRIISLFTVEPTFSMHVTPADAQRTDKFQ